MTQGKYERIISTLPGVEIEYPRITSQCHSCWWPVDARNRPWHRATCVTRSSAALVSIVSKKTVRSSFFQEEQFLLHVPSQCQEMMEIITQLTLNVRGPSYLGLTRSISWLLMPRLLTSPGHQQPWYWLSIICRSWSYLMKDFNYLCHINVE